MKKIRKRDPRPRLLKRQRDVLCDVMLSAGSCETWLTLVELSRLTQYGEASISAQLRHLRKPQYGAFVVEKRRREVAELMCAVEHGPVWEYRLRREIREARPLAKTLSGDGSLGAAAIICGGNSDA
ncbi:MAG: hypothetical protein M3P45_14345 [Acidobacteriota bacterium]|nr:hypothetical protein [Acidobacteriota bacterium]